MVRGVHRFRWLPLIIPLVLGACSVGAEGAAPVGGGQMQRDFHLVRHEFSGRRARATVAFVEQYFRVPGNSGFNASIDRVVDILRRAGYVPESEAKPGDRLLFHVERRPMREPTWEPEDGSLTILGSPTPLLRFATNRNMLAINSYSTPNGGVEADVADVGAGSDSDFAKVDVAGKIVYGEAASARLFTEAVQKRGAIGVLAYRMPGYTQPELHPTSIQFTRIPLDTVRQSWAIQLSYAARTALRSALAHGPVRVRVVTRSRIYPSEERTVVADVLGSARPDERFLFSAHVQEPGANDNASGVATQAEMARVLATLVHHRAVDPERTITFIWGLETVMTRRYLADDSVRARGVHWGVSLDMVGEDTRKTGGTFLIEKMPDPSAIWTRGRDHHTEWGGTPLTVAELTPHYFNDFILAVCQAQAAETGWTVRTNPYEGGSDHTALIHAGKAGVLLWHFTDHYYHTDGDRLPMVSASEMTNVGTSALVAALILSSPDSTTARTIIDDVTRAARDRLQSETRLSAQAIATGEDPQQQARIIRAWTNWYRDAVRTARDIEVGGPSSATVHAIDSAATAIDALGTREIAQLP